MNGTGPVQRTSVCGLSALVCDAARTLFVLTIAHNPARSYEAKYAREVEISNGRAAMMGFLVGSCDLSGLICMIYMCTWS